MEGIGRPVNWRRALLLLGSLGLVALVAIGIAGLIPSPRVAVPLTKAPVVGGQPIPTTGSPDHSPATTQPAVAPTPTQLAILTRLGISIANGPGIPVDGDPESPSVPTARDLGVLNALPADWWAGFANATTALEALATPNPANGAYLQSHVAPDLYAQWMKTITAKSPAGTFTLRKLHLAGRNGATNDAMTLIGLGTYKNGTQSITYTVTARMTRTHDVWVVAEARFEAWGR